jgi:hypothetical protein
MMSDMRTTLTIDDDVASEIEARMRTDGRSFKDVVNELLRKGLRVTSKPAPRPPIEIRTFSSDWLPGVDRLRLNALNDELEIESFLEKRGREET